MITILLIVSRTDHLEKVFTCLENLERPHDTELLIVIDGRDKHLQDTVDDHLDLLHYKSVRIITFDSDGAEKTINERRYRISALHNFAKHYVSDKSEYVFSVEDDTTFPETALNELKLAFDINPLCAFAEGVELGRHFTPYVGAWRVDSLENTTKVTSMMPGEDQEEIDAGGLYCCLVRTDLYKRHHFEPFDQEGTNGLSCDVNFGLWLRKQGYTCYIDWSVLCRHHTDNGYISIENTEPQQIEFTYTDKWTVQKI